jgi:hypothetical protein
LHTGTLNRYSSEGTGYGHSLWLTVDGELSRDDGPNLMTARFCVNDRGMATTAEDQQHASEGGQAF